MNTWTQEQAKTSFDRLLENALGHQEQIIQLKNQQKIVVVLLEDYLQTQIRLKEFETQLQPKPLTKWQKMVARIEKKAFDLGDDTEAFNQNRQAFRESFVLKNEQEWNIDLMIAASALNQHAVLVSADKIFQDICLFMPELKLENWTMPC